MSRHRIVAYATLALAPAAAAAQDSAELVRAAVAGRLPGVVIESVTESPIAGVFEVAYPGGVLYVSADGRYALSGRLLDLETRKDLTERTRAAPRLRALAGVPEARMIIYEPPDDAAHTITTFTDIDCPYCRKMHREMAAMNAAGIRVRYLLFPRAGFASASYDKAVSVWCAPDRLDAMTRAKSGETPEKRECDNPVAEHMALARAIGLTGTPFTITDSGRVIAGYLPAAELLERLSSDKHGDVR